MSPELRVSTDEEAEYLRAAIKAMAMIHFDMFRECQYLEVTMGKLDVDGQKTLLNYVPTALGKQFRFWPLVALFNANGVDPSTISGETLASILQLRLSNVTVQNFIVNFNALLGRLKTILAALQITSTPSLVAYMVVRAHNKLGINLNTFAHPAFNDSDWTDPDEWH